MSRHTEIRPADHTITDVNVLASRLRLHGAQLGIGECAKKRKQTANEPRKVNKFGGSHGLHHLRRNEKNAASNDGADHDGSCMAQAKITGQLRTGFGRLWFGGHGRSEKYSGKFGDFAQTG